MIPLAHHFKEHKIAEKPQWHVNLGDTMALATFSDASCLLYNHENRTIELMSITEISDILCSALSEQNAASATNLKALKQLRIAQISIDGQMATLAFRKAFFVNKFIHQEHYV
jgi:hypothetical protein